MSRMIHFLLNIMLRVWVICALAVAVALLLQREAAPVLSQPGFDACDLPCWAGVTPGETPYVDAKQIITQNVEDTRLQFPDFLTEVSTTQFSGAQGEVLGAVYEDRGLVGSLRLDFPIPLWHLLEGVGTPVCLQHTLQGADMTLYSVYWQANTLYIMGIFQVQDSADWRLDQTTISLFIFSGSNPCANESALPWQGFGGFNPRRIL